jgi:hypothetical protein
MYPMDVSLRIAYWRIFVRAVSASSWGDICIEEYKCGRVSQRKTNKTQTNWQLD